MKSLSVPTPTDPDGMSVLQTLRPLTMELVTHAWLKSWKKRILAGVQQLEAWLLPHTDKITQHVNNNVHELQKFPPNSHETVFYSPP